MAKKDDMNKLLERENRRKTSIVSGIAGIDKPTIEENEPQVSSPSAVIVKPKKETRSVRKHVLLTPSLAKKAVAKSNKIGLPLNEVIYQLLESWTNE